MTRINSIGIRGHPYTMPLGKCGAFSFVHTMCALLTCENGRFLAGTDNWLLFRHYSILGAAMLTVAIEMVRHHYTLLPGSFLLTYGSLSFNCYACLGADINTLWKCYCLIRTRYWYDFCLSVMCRVHKNCNCRTVKTKTGSLRWIYAIVCRNRNGERLHSCFARHRRRRFVVVSRVSLAVCTVLFICLQSPKIQVDLLDDSNLMLSLVNGADTIAAQLHAQMCRELKLPETASKIFAIWICSESLRTFMCFFSLFFSNLHFFSAQNYN